MTVLLFFCAKYISVRFNNRASTVIFMCSGLNKICPCGIHPSADDKTPNFSLNLVFVSAILQSSPAPDLTQLNATRLLFSTIKVNSQDCSQISFGSLDATCVQSTRTYSPKCTRVCMCVLKRRWNPNMYLKGRCTDLWGIVFCSPPCVELMASRSSWIHVCSLTV